VSDQSALVQFIDKKHAAEMEVLHKELAELKLIASEKPESNVQYITLVQNVKADSSEMYQKKMLQNLLVFHRLQDPEPGAFDTTGSLLQQGNRRLVNYLFERDNVALRDNIIRVQDRMVASLKEQRTADSTYTGLLAFQLAHTNKQKEDLSWQLSKLGDELDAMTLNRNRWRAGGLVFAGAVTLAAAARK
jgi:hypothetical protein